MSDLLDDLEREVSTWDAPDKDLTGVVRRGRRLAWIRRGIGAALCLALIGAGTLGYTAWSQDEPSLPPVDENTELKEDLSAAEIFEELSRLESLGDEIPEIGVSTPPAPDEDELVGIVHVGVPDSDGGPSSPVTLRVWESPSTAFEYHYPVIFHAVHEAGPEFETYEKQVRDVEISCRKDASGTTCFFVRDVVSVEVFDRAPSAPEAERIVRGVLLELERLGTAKPAPKPTPQETSIDLESFTINDGVVTIRPKKVRPGDTITLSITDPPADYGLDWYLNKKEGPSDWTYIGGYSAGPPRQWKKHHQNRFFFLPEWRTVGIPSAALNGSDSIELKVPPLEPGTYGIFGVFESKKIEERHIGLFEVVEP